MPLDYERFFESTFSLEEGEVAVVLTNPPSVSPERFAMAERWRDGLARLAENVGADVLPLVTYADTGVNGAPLPEFCQMGDISIATEEVLSRATLVLALVAHSATGPLLDATKRYPELRVASLPGILPEMETTALLADPADLIARNNILRDLLNDAVLARIEFSTGDRLQIDLRRNKSGSNDAHSDNGYLPSKATSRLINLPSGETWRVPYEEENPTAFDGTPEEQSRTEGILPTEDENGAARLVVRRGRIVEIEGESAAADKYRATFAADPARGNVAEFGLGSNPKAVVRGSILEDEKAGPHIAYGRSDYLGGLIGAVHFLSPENVLHIDIVYAAASPVNFCSLVLISESGAETTVIVDGEYVIF